MTGVLPLYSADEMRALDSRAIEELGIPGAVLMERAGLAAAHELLARYPQARRVAVVCGAGNNGGDGFVVARHLQSAGLEVSTHLVGQAARLAIDARGNLEIARQLGIPLERNPPSSRLRAALRRSDVVVDALFGTGFTGAPRAAAAAAIEELNRASAPVVALDVPSGVDASDGTVAGACVTAQVTITFHGPKAGLVIAPGARHAGDVVVADIGIPPQLERPAAAGLASHDLLDLVPRRGARRPSTGPAQCWWSAERPAWRARPCWPAGPPCVPAPGSPGWRCPRAWPRRSARIARADGAAIAWRARAGGAGRRRGGRVPGWAAMRPAGDLARRLARGGTGGRW